MQTRHKTDPPQRARVAAPAPGARPDARRAGIERLAADALDAIERQPTGSACDPGASEYASWLRLLRRTTP